MAEKNFAGVTVTVNEEGYMTDSTKWTKEIGIAIGKEEGIDLTEKHFEVINFLRERVSKGEALSLRSIGKSGVVDTKGFYDLFPGAPLKKATKIAGLPKPTSCV